MYLLTIDLYELGQYLRIVLWVCMPLIIISLLITTWLQYRRRFLDPGGLLLSVEGLDNAMEPEGMSGLPGDSLSYREHNPDEHAERHPGNQVERDPDPAGNDQGEKENVSQWKGKDNIYQGILWMKEKYEQYRNQADQRYELLKEELNRSERRYQDLLLSIEENKSTQPPTGHPQELILREGSAGEGVKPAQLISDGVKPAQLIIDELEEQLRIERLKVEELVARLQTNSQLLLNIYQELDKSAHTAKEAE